MAGTGREAGAIEDRRFPAESNSSLARAASLDGVHHRSERRRGGRCLAVFQAGAAAFSHMEFGAVVLEWDGTVSRRIA